MHVDGIVKCVWMKRELILWYTAKADPWGGAWLTNLLYVLYNVLHSVSQHPSIH